MIQNIKNTQDYQSNKHILEVCKDTKKFNSNITKDGCFLKPEKKENKLPIKIIKNINFCNFPAIDKNRIRNKLSKALINGNSDISQKRIEQLRRLISYQHNIPADPEARNQGVYLVWRGLNAKQLITMTKNKSAGNASADPNTPAPSECAASRQVAEYESLPEFTANPAIAEQFGTNGYVGLFAVKGRFLSPGSGIEEGWVAGQSAPAELVLFREGRQSLF